LSHPTSFLFGNATPGDNILRVVAEGMVVFHDHFYNIVFGQLELIPT